MTARTARFAVVAGALALFGCSERAPDLLTFTGTQEGPDEFSIVPAKPLETPQDLSALPPPAPGAPNRADATPIADAVAALGGAPGRLQQDAQSPDTALIAHAGRFGRDPAIRTTLATEDLEFRRRNDGLFLERAFNRNLYYEAYRSQELDQHAERRRLRRAGVSTAEAPPEVLFSR